ncbi:hypothetical protein ACGF5O_34365 [Streptomyces sp. NPDC048291]|uniref:hypothetical protein n=1 Tax=Streptomyces sp. NPDC048291 TaxID=3365530 RepID=UPI003716DE40
MSGRVFVRAPLRTSAVSLPSLLRRRSLIVSVASAAVLTGCSSGSDSPGSAGSTSVSARARARAARDSRGLLRQYDAVLAVHPVLAERLRPLRAEVAAHAAAFEEGTASPTATGSPSPTATGSPSPTASASASPTVPADEKSALAALAAAERNLADRRAQALLDVPGELARLLAGVAAAGAAHAYLLTKGDR